MSQCIDPERCLLKPTKLLLVLLVFTWVSEDKNIFKAFIFPSWTAGKSLSIPKCSESCEIYPVLSVRQHTHEVEEEFQITATADFI